MGFPAIVLWGPELIQIYNDGCSDLMGAKHPIALGQPVRTCWPETWDVTSPIYDRVRAGETLCFEDKLILLHRDRDIEDAWFTLSFSPLQDTDGVVAGILALAIETTDRHQAETALRHSETRFRAFVEASSDVIYRMNADWSETHRLNDQGVLSYKPEPTGAWLEHYIDPSDQAMVRAAILRSVQTGAVLELEHRVRRADGSPSWVLSRAVPVRDRSGTVVEWLGTATDVTARHRVADALRESETRTGDLLDGIALAVWEADRSGAIVTDSPTWCAFTGQSTAEWMGMGWLNAIHPQDQDRTKRMWHEAAATREAVDTEYRLRKASGGWHWVNVRAAPVLDENGEVLKWVGMNIDVHDRRRAEERLRESEERGTFLLALSDALRPLTDPAIIEATACRLLGERLDVERAYYVELSREEGTARVGQDYRRSGMPSFAGEHALWMMEWCLTPLETGKPLVVEDLWNDFCIPASDKDRLAKAGLIAFTSTSLVKEDKLVGTFSVTASAPRVWTPAEIMLVQETGERVWEAVERARVEARLRKSEQRFRDFANASADVLWMADAQGERLEYLSPAFDKMFGLPRERVMPAISRVLPLIHQDDREAFLSTRARLLAREVVVARYRVIRPNGSVLHTRNTAFLVRNEDGDVVQLGGIVQDLSDMDAARAALEAEKERFRALVEGIPSLVWRASAEGLWTWTSPQWLAFTGQTLAQSLGLGWLDPIHPEDRAAAEAAWQVAHLQGTLDVEFRLRRAADGDYVWYRTRSSPVHDATGQLVEWFGTTTEIQKLKELQEQLLDTALHDGLTGLHSRVFLIDRLDRVLRHQAERAGSAFAVLFLDLDRFKLINDSLGHQAGDHLLVEVGKRLQRCTRPEDTVARLGGDEFALLIENVSDPVAAVQVAERVITAMRQPVRLGQQDVFTMCSIGIAQVNGNYATAEEVLRDADIAMYDAKRRGSGRYAVFSESMRDGIVDAFELRTDLRNAIDRHQFSLQYQPIYDCSINKIVGVEALLRWEHPQRGRVPPAVFIPVCEESGLIREVGRWVLAEACGQLRSWCDTLPDLDLYLNVNTSGVELNDPTYLSIIQQALAAVDLDPSRLQVEVTESVFLHQPAVAGAMLGNIRALGVRVALDDFGTGYSSLSYLDRYQIDSIKIDRSFVSGMSLRPTTDAVVAAIVELGRATNLSVVAEGVETEDQLNALLKVGCTLVQGYLLARPMNAADVLDLLTSQRN